MWSSRNPRRRSSQAGASRSPSGSTPASAIASPSATPSSSSRSTASSTSRRPTSAREPNVGVLKRAPSSSANEITASGTLERAATANAAATPSAPSKRPPSRTVSRCEPTAHQGPGASGHAHRLPAGSRSSRRPIVAARRANQAAASSSSRVQARRVRRVDVVEPDRHEVDEQLLQLGGGDHATSPPETTMRTGLRPNRYGTCSTGPSSSTRSARLPTSIEPRSASPSTHAAFSVQAASASRADQP